MLKRIRRIMIKIVIIAMECTSILQRPSFFLLITGILQPVTHNLYCFTRHIAPCSRPVHLIPAMNSSIGYAVQLAVLFTLDLQPGAFNLLLLSWSNSGKKRRGTEKAKLPITIVSWFYKHNVNKLVLCLSTAFHEIQLDLVNMNLKSAYLRMNCRLAIGN